MVPSRAERPAEPASLARHRRLVQGISGEDLAAIESWMTGARGHRCRLGLRASLGWRSRAGWFASAWAGGDWAARSRAR
jgi:hypothetical protein